MCWYLPSDLVRSPLTFENKLKCKCQNLEGVTVPKSCVYYSTSEAISVKLTKYKLN